MQYPKIQHIALAAQCENQNIKLLLLGLETLINCHYSPIKFAVIDV